MKITVVREITIVLSDADAKELKTWMLLAWQALHNMAGDTTHIEGFHEPVVQTIYDALVGKP